jgi:tetratricopeptide (TPR) repeat protein
MKRRILLLATAFATIALASVVQAQPSSKTEDNDRLQQLESIYGKGMDLVQAGRMREAFKTFQQGLSLAPDEPAFLMNTGLTAMEINRDDTAAALLGRLISLHPGEYPSIYPELIQAYQALGRLDERDSVRDLLFALRKKGTDTALTHAAYYCRDRFTVGTWKVTAFEHYELVGDQAVRYAFVVDDTTGKKKGMVISLGSYELTNRVWHETTTPRPREEDRLFHLDAYYDGGHATYRMFAPEPPYDQTRDAVVGILENRIKPQSSSTIPNDSTTAKKPKKK